MYCIYKKENKLQKHNALKLYIHEIQFNEFSLKKKKVLLIFFFIFSQIWYEDIRCVFSS